MDECNPPPVIWPNSDGNVPVSRLSFRKQGLMDSTRHVIGCHSTQESRVQHAFDDVASTIHQSLGPAVNLDALGADSAGVLRRPEGVAAEWPADLGGIWNGTIVAGTGTGTPVITAVIPGRVHSADACGATSSTTF